MPIVLTIEDGTGVANANALIDVAFADAYHAERFNDGWAGDDESKKSAIVVATDHVTTTYRYKGWITYPGIQTLPFPRTGIEDDEGELIPGDVVPVAVKRAVAEFALVALKNGSAIAPSVLQKLASRRRERVGSIETDTEYLVHDQAAIYPRAYALLAPFIVTSPSGSGASPIVRA